MIDWSKTYEKYNYKNHVEIKGLKRPIVICNCDGCGKEKEITIRVKSKIINEQFTWYCPACVATGRSAEISKRMTQLWTNDDYRNNQIEIKSQINYREHQSTKSKERWEDNSYRDRLETGIDIETYLSTSKEKFNDKFTYQIESFVNWKTKITIECSTCNITFNRLPLPHLNCGTCPVCKIPIEIVNLLSSNAPHIINDRKTIAPLELDIHWPCRKLAIEYHGLYWHSYNHNESRKEIYRHQEKALRCMEKGIRLIQITDREWLKNKELLKSMINNINNKSVKHHARKLRVKSVDDRDTISFFNDNHLQGYRCAKNIVALICNDDIVMAMSFSKHKDGFEIIRMATKMGSHVSGGASKILNYFIKTFKPKTIYTFADLRHSVGNVYNKLGFTRISITKPGYFYHRNDVILSRHQCQKHKLRALLGDGFDPLLSEPQNMFLNGYRRTWDAGHIKLVKIIEN